MTPRAPFIAVAIAFALGCRGAAPAPAAPVAAPAGEVRVEPALVAAGRVRTAAVERRAPRRALAVPGEVVSAKAGAAEAGALVSGRVASIAVVEGDVVRRGQVLALVESPEAARAVAELLRARSRYAVATRKLERQRALDRDRATSGNALDDAHAEASEARAALAAAATVVRAVGAEEPTDADDGPPRALTARSAVRAPIDGRIASRAAILGGAVTPERALFKIVGEREGDVVARVPEALAERAAFRDGAPLRIVTRASDGKAATCDGLARGSLGAIDPATRALPIRVEPSGPCPTLRPGSFVDVVATEPGEGAALVIPRAAVLEVRGIPGAFVGTAPGVYRFRALTLDAAPGPDAIVREGLHEGEAVVVEGAVLLKGELLRAELEGS